MIQPAGVFQLKGDVRKNENESGKTFVLVQDGKGFHAELPPVLGHHGKVGRHILFLCVKLALNVFECILNQVPVDQGIDRTMQTDKAVCHQVVIFLVISGKAWALNFVQYPLRLPIIQQDAAHRVADQHPLGQFGHNCGQYVFFRFSLGFGRLNSLVNDVFGSFVLIPAGVDQLGKCLDLPAAVNLQAVGRIDGIHHLGFFDELIQWEDVKAKKPIQSESESHKQEHTGTEKVPELLFKQAHQHVLFGRVDLPPEKHRQGHGNGSGERHTDDSEQPEFIAQSHPQSRSLTCLTTSALEKGLVM